MGEVEVLQQRMAEVSGAPASEIREDTRLAGDLGMSSFDLADTVISVEEAYGIRIPDERFRELQTVADIARVIREENAL